MRTFSSGATRDNDDTKHDLEGFLDPMVLRVFAEYMTRHRRQANGKLRDSDNWKNGIPLEAYMKSGWRHFHDWWLEHRGYESREGLNDAMCGLLFNVMGYIYEINKYGKNGKKKKNNKL